jgi:Predicted membrane protein
MASMVTSVVDYQERRIEHSGPLPPPEMLREYEKIVPNAAERFLSLVENEQKHRHEKEVVIT